MKREDAFRVISSIFAEYPTVYVDTPSIKMTGFTIAKRKRLKRKQRKGKEK